MSKTLKLVDPAVELSDEDLLSRIRQGETDLFGPFVRRFERELYGYLRRYLGDQVLADDVFQNTFLQVYQKLDQYEPGRPVRPWLYTIATHQAIDALRRSARRPSISLDHVKEGSRDGAEPSLADLMEDRGKDPFANLEEAERRDRVRAGLENLPEHLRSTVILAYYQGLKYREIADVLGIPVGTVKSRLHMALAKLHQAWRDEPSLTREDS